MTALWIGLALLGAEIREDAPTEQAACELCHQDVVTDMTSRVHMHSPDNGDAACIDCHTWRAENPHRIAVEKREDYEEVFDALEGKFPIEDVRSMATCYDCHELEEYMESVHANAKEREDGKTYENATCTSCHGTAHDQVRENQSKLAMTNRCITCHDFAEAGKVPTPVHIVDTYRDTIHGKKLRLGMQESAACHDCHRGHHIFGPDDERSSVHASNKAEMCGECHEGAADNENFLASISHTPNDPDANFIGWAVRLSFSLLAALTLTFLFFHVVVDLFNAARGAMLRKEHHFDPDGPVHADDEVARLDIHGRIQHWMTMVSFTTLVVTGWPLRAAHLDQSQSLVDAMGGIMVVSWAHRLAGALMIITAIYHIGYLANLFRKGKLSFEMLPSPKDAVDLIQNWLFLLGLRKERPHIGKWSYHEKLDYWAEWWGSSLMSVTGLVLWFPVLAALYLPPDVIRIAQTAHGIEALLAALAIFIWHFYNVHLRPAIFPMSWAWLNGRLPVEALYDEHRAQYIELFGDKAPKPPRLKRSWHSDPRWSFIALGVTVASAVLIAVGNAQAMRDQIMNPPTNQSAEQERLAKIEERRKNAPKPDDPLERDIIAFANAVEGSPLGLDDEGEPGEEGAKETSQWGTCLKCHEEENWASSGNFAHRDHFTDYYDEPERMTDCGSCHEINWHEGITAKLDACNDCHEPEEMEDAIVSAKENGRALPEWAAEYLDEQGGDGSEDDDEEDDVE